MTLPKTKTLARIERQKIYSSLEILGHLRHVGGVLVDQVYDLAPDSYFEATDYDEWKLMPKRWVLFQFSRGRGYAPKIHISLDMWPSNLEEDTSLVVKQGLKPQWSRVTISSISELEDALHIIKIVHKVSGK
jgi:hypothetical protein